MSIKKYKEAISNLEDFPMSTFLEKAEEKLKGKSFTNIEKYIFYDALDNDFFSMTKASSNWSWAPNNDDAHYYVCVYHNGPEDVFTAPEYIYNTIKSGVIDHLLEEYNIEKTEEVKYLIDEHREHKLAELLSKEQKKDLIDESFYFDKQWLKKQAREKVELALDRFRDKIRQAKEMKKIYSQ
jgi:hypothetical protein